MRQKRSHSKTDLVKDEELLKKALVKVGLDTFVNGLPEGFIQQMLMLA